MTQIPPTTCEICHAPIKHIPAGVSRRTGKPYSEFWACTNPDCKYTWKPEKPAQPQKADPIALLMDEIIAFRKEFNERFDGLAKYMAEKEKK